MNDWYVNMLYLLLSFVFMIAVGISFVILIVSCIKKKWNKKIVVAFILNLVLLGCTKLFISSHSTYYRYNDWWILGNEISEVQEKYGEPDLGNYAQGKSGEVGYYIYTDNGPIMPDYLEHYYYIKYNEDGIVTKVYVSGQPGG